MLGQGGLAGQSGVEWDRGYLASSGCGRGGVSGWEVGEGGSRNATWRTEPVTTKVWYVFGRVLPGVKGAPNHVLRP